VGRVRRYGQTKTVHVYRFLTTDSIDEEIYKQRVTDPKADEEKKKREEEEIRKRVDDAEKRKLKRKEIGEDEEMVSVLKEDDVAALES